jgi:predicted enzyme related to lactoylglutathione lyase
MKLEKLVIDVQVHDLDRAINFYRDILKLSLIHKDADWASFEISGAEIHLYLHGGVEYGLEFRVSNLEEVVEDLKEKGLKFFVDKNQPNFLKLISDEIMEFPWGKTAFLKDSEGNQIALIEDKF